MNKFAALAPGVSDPGTSRFGVSRSTVLAIVVALWAVASVGLLAAVGVGRTGDAARSDLVAAAFAEPAIREDLGNRVADAVIDGTPMLSDFEFAADMVRDAAQSPRVDPLLDDLVEADLAARFGERSRPVDISAAELIQTDNALLEIALQAAPEVQVPLRAGAQTSWVDLIDRALPLFIGLALFAQIGGVVLAGRCAAARAGAAGATLGALLCLGVWAITQIGNPTLVTLLVGSIFDPGWSLAAIALALWAVLRAQLAESGRWAYREFNPGDEDWLYTD